MRRMIYDILSLVSIDSVNGDRVGIQKAQKCVIQIAGRLGLETRIVADGQVVLCALDFTTPKGFGFVTHIDTVPYDERKWMYNPLGERVDGRVYGRGVVDDKGATVVAMYAIAEKKASNIMLIVGSSEEGEWTDMKALLTSKVELPPAMATLDGDGVQNGCRGYLDLLLSFDNTVLDDIFIPEGANNTVPAMAVAMVGEKEYVEVGKAAHSSTPEKGENALIKLILNNPEIFGGGSALTNLMVECKYSEQTPKRLGFKNGTSITPTNVELCGKKIVINLNIRLSPDMTEDDVMSAIRMMMLGFGCYAEIKELTLASSVPADSKYIYCMLKAYEEVIESPTTATIAPGIGYNAALPNCCIFGPRWDPIHDEPDCCHAANESRTESDLYRFRKMLGIFIDLMNE